MPATRRLAAILAADVVGYSRLIGTDEQGTLGRLRAIRIELIDPSIAAHSGRIVKTTRDGLLAEFVSTVDALRWAGEIQMQMAERNLPLTPESRIDFRMGIHQATSSSRTATFLATVSTLPRASKGWPSPVGSASRQGCRKTLPASSISGISATNSSKTSRAPCECTRLSPQSSCVLPPAASRSIPRPALHRRSAVRQSVTRSGAGILCGRDYR
jgi:hypothetical protein